MSSVAALAPISDHPVRRVLARLFRVYHCQQLNAQLVPDGHSSTLTAVATVSLTPFFAKLYGQPSQAAHHLGCEGGQAEASTMKAGSS